MTRISIDVFAKAEFSLPDLLNDIEGVEGVAIAMLSAPDLGGPQPGMVSQPGMVTIVSHDFTDWGKATGLLLNLGKVPTVKKVENVRMISRFEMSESAGFEDIGTDSTDRRWKETIRQENRKAGGVGGG